MKYKNPKLTVDGILFDDDVILLIKRKNPPYKNKWALPGGFVEYNETTEDAVVREFKEETSLNCKIEELFGVYSKPNRDPRGHTVSIVYILKHIGGMLCGGDDASMAKFFQLDSLPELAFDHKKIIEDFVRRKKL